MAREPSCSVDVLARFIFTIYGDESLQVARQRAAGGPNRGREFVTHWIAVASRLRDLLGK